MAKQATPSLVDPELTARFALEVIELWEHYAVVDPIRLHHIVTHAYQRAEHCLDLIQKIDPEPRSLACKAGCASCCYNQVELTAPEALLLGTFLTENLSPPELQLLQENVKESCRRRAGWTKRELAQKRSELPCPLLDHDRCLAYPRRPLMCRAMHALQNDACRREFADPALSVVEFYLHRHVIYVSISQGLVDACRALGVQAGPVELVSALQQYFAGSELQQSWLAGEKVFTA
jgi:Fe-S-cluster containining protein